MVLVMSDECYTDNELREIAKRVLEGEEVEVYNLSFQQKRKIREYYLSMRFKRYNNNVSKNR